MVLDWTTQDYFPHGHNCTHPGPEIVQHINFPTTIEV